LFTACSLATKLYVEEQRDDSISAFCETIKQLNDDTVLSCVRTTLNIN